jgi:hypothetical protein
MSWSEFATVFALTVVLISATVIAMAIGVIARRPCLRGSCGGPAVIGPDGQKISCNDCPNRQQHAHE